MSMENIYLAIPLAPLFGAIIAGLFGSHCLYLFGDGAEGFCD